MLLVVKNRNNFLNSLWLAGWGRLLLTGGAFSVTLYAGEPVRFSEHLLAGENTYTFGLAAVDIDGDGDLDLTYPDIFGTRGAPDAQRESTLYWLENNGRGDFQRHVIYQNQHGWFERHATGDINGDRRPDVAIVDNLKGRLFWFANPDRPADSHWKRYVITTKCPNAYDVGAVRLGPGRRPGRGGRRIQQRSDHLVREPRPGRLGRRVDSSRDRRGDAGGSDDRRRRL